MGSRTGAIAKWAVIYQDAAGLRGGGFGGIQCGLSDSPKPWCLYVLRCADGTLYCGITNDLAQRLAKHNRGTGARYTRGRGPLVLVYSWPAGSHSAALKAEAAFKALRRKAKDRWLAAAENQTCPLTMP